MSGLLYPYEGFFVSGPIKSLDFFSGCKIQASTSISCDSTSGDEIWGEKITLRCLELIFFPREKLNESLRLTKMHASILIFNLLFFGCKQYLTPIVRSKEINNS